MAQLKGSKTEENLKYAFAGESQANRRYLYFAAKADVEGYNDVAAVFRSTAEGETGHAHGHLECLEQVGDPATGLPIGPTRANLKATLMLEYDDPVVRTRELAKLKGIEDRVYVQVNGFDKVYAIADEDLERENEEKTSSVHFLRFEFTPPVIAAFRQGAAVAIGVDHPAYSARVDEIAPEVQTSLAKDLA